MSLKPMSKPTPAGRSDGAKAPAPKGLATLPVVTSIIVRSEAKALAGRHGAGPENAWVSLMTNRGETTDTVLLREFKAEDHGQEAWAQASKYGRRLAEKLAVPLKKKRDASVGDNVPTRF